MDVDYHRPIPEDGIIKEVRLKEVVLSNKRKDFIEKLARSYTTQYDAVFVEKLNVRGMLEQDSNGRNIASMAWSDAIKTFERHGDKNGCRVMTVPPEGTTKRCA
ncbi:IS200/IS605 family accessory protein TnpB-related protein [Natronorubrum sp. A-ect3]|uniref:IS200/IS605 family accessory protein TnpB-related protein n=1 Tax=Natronorubrum sp. A-ect3 TaxID=3242698 RepID=UPI00359D5FF7